MNHFEPIHAENNYKNELMDHMRRQTIALESLLEQIAQLLQPKETEPVKSEPTKRNYQRRNPK